MRRFLLVLSILSVGAPVHADPCADARAELKKKDLTRASIDAAACGDDALIADVEARAEKAGYSPVDVVTDPDGSTVVVEPAPDRPFTTPRRVWMPEGRFTVTALMDGQPMVETLVVLDDGDGARVFLTLPPPPADPSDGAVDMGDEGGGEMSSGPPPKVELPSLLPDKYQRGVDAQGGDEAAGPDRPRGVQLWLGVAMVDGVTSVGGQLVAERSFGGGAWVVAPSAAVTVTAWSGEVFESADLAVAVQRRFVKPGSELYLGLGPGVIAMRGTDEVRGVGAGIVVDGALVTRSGTCVGGRASFPVLTSQDAFVATFSLGIGHRW